MSRSLNPRPSLASNVSFEADSFSTRMSSSKSLKTYMLLDDTEAEKQIRLLKQLQEEIQGLKYENHELKFLLYVALKHVQDTVGERPKSDSFKLEMENMAKNYLEESRSENKSIQLELDAATNMLEESKWVQHHYEQRVREQELEIEELQKQLMDMKTKEFTLLQLKVPATDYRGSRTYRRRGDSSPNHNKCSGRQRSSSTVGNQRISRLSSFLPDNYKDTVATLPPIPIISGQQEVHHPTKLWAHMKNAT